MIDIKTAKEIEIMKQGGTILSSVLKAVARNIKAGVSAYQLDQLANNLIEKAGADPSFLGHEGYPASLCVSLNEEVVHGLPKKDKVIKSGDVVKIDLGVKYKGLYTDMAMTVPVGQIDKKTKELIKVTKKSLDKAIKIIKPGIQVGDISSVIQQYVESQGFFVVTKLVGHGVGRAVHEEPRVPNYGEAGTGPVLETGACIAIEPMVIIGGSDVVVSEDGWTYKSADDSTTAHFEKTVAIVKSGHLVLT